MSDGSTGGSSSGTANNRRGRPPSTLVASRRYAESQEAEGTVPHEGIALHEGDAVSTGSLGNSTDNDKKDTKFDQQWSLHDDDQDRSSTNIILPKSSIQKLDTSKHQASLLMPPVTSQDATEDEERVAVPSVYSWGRTEDFNFFDADEGSQHKSTGDPQIVPSDSRVGRSELVSVSFGPRHAAVAT